MVCCRHWYFGERVGSFEAYAEAQGRGTRPAPDIDNSAENPRSRRRTPIARATGTGPRRGRGRSTGGPRRGWAPWRRWLGRELSSVRLAQDHDISGQYMGNLWRVNPWQFEAYLLLQGAQPRLGPPVDRPHPLRGPVPVARAIGVGRRDLGFSGELSLSGAGRVPRPCASAYASNEPTHSPKYQCRQHTT